MKAIIMEEYGGVDVLKEVEGPIPEAQPGMVVVRVAATSVNDPDIHMRRSGPFPTMPKEMRPALPHMAGEDFSGVVHAVGEGVEGLAPGDHVIGITMQGTTAEYIAVPAAGLIGKVPAGLDLVELGGLYVAAVTARSAVVTNGEVRPGQTVLVHGAAGGVGSMAVQIAKAHGAHVIATCSADSAEYVRGLGADETIDYRTQDFTKAAKDVDLCVNLTGQKTLSESYKIVRRGGNLVTVSGVPNPAKAALHGIHVRYAMGDMTPEAREEVVGLYADGKLKVNVMQTYPLSLEGVRQAHTDFEAGHNRGKRIIVADWAR